jgi:hypothetical protein
LFKDSFSPKVRELKKRGQRDLSFPGRDSSCSCNEEEESSVGISKKVREGFSST